MIFATDLDNTIISTKYKNLESKVCIEWYKNKPFSFISTEAYSILQKILLLDSNNNKFYFIPVSTRSYEQYSRIKLSDRLIPKYQLCANGILLLKNGILDEDWKLDVDIEFKKYFSDIKKFLEYLRIYLPKEYEIRLSNSYMILIKIPENRIDHRDFHIGTIENFINNVSGLKYRVSYEHSLKILIIPYELTKERAIEKLQIKLDNYDLISAGDSEVFDYGLLNLANIQGYTCSGFNKKFYFDQEKIIVKFSSKTFSKDLLDHCWNNHLSRF